MLLTLVSLTLGAPTVDVNALKAVVKANHEKINACYEPAAKENPKLQGDVLVSFVLTTTGTAKNTKVKKSDLKNKAVEDCIVGVFKAMAFPKAQGGEIPIDYPLGFSPPEVVEETKQGPPKKPGSLPVQVVRDTISAQKNQVQACYDNEKKNNAALAPGKVQVEMMVEVDGVVSSAVVKESTVKSEPVEKCLVELSKKLKFPKPDGETGVRLSFPFQFQ